MHHVTSANFWHEMDLTCAGGVSDRMHQLLLLLLEREVTSAASSSRWYHWHCEAACLLFNWSLLQSNNMA